VDALRRDATFRSKLPLLVEADNPGDDEVVTDGAMPTAAEHVVADERLRLIFMCCHPALAPEAQSTLTLRLVCGMSTADIARAFLVSEPTMGARLTRAKKKISAARIPIRVPGAAELPDRLRTVLGVIHLLFTMGHTAPSGTSLMRPELVDQALQITRVLQDLMPDAPEIRGLLALLVVTDARRATRIGADGRLLRLAEQDRSRWDRSAIAEAHELIVDGLRPAEGIPLSGGRQSGPAPAAGPRRGGIGRRPPGSRAGRQRNRTGVPRRRVSRPDPAPQPHPSP
jgi:RNA polymerase sigma-70 factor (ECF subfamily)